MDKFLLQSPILNHMIQNITVNIGRDMTFQDICGTFHEKASLR